MKKWLDNIKKDDKGYWNPDNWGKPVEIGSNRITMKGVNQPLIGISDSGDIQYMEPGQDYKFKGSRVTEFPLAQDGTTVRKKVRVLAEHKPLGDTGTRDEAFVQEAEKIRKYYGDDVDFQLSPFYGKEEFDKIDLSNVSDQDEVFLLGHKGDMLGGVGHPEIADTLQEAGVKKCYMGSCSMEEFIDPYRKLEGEVYYRPKGSYYGPRSGVTQKDGTPVKDFFFGLKWTGNPNDHYGAGVADPVKGEDYERIFNKPKSKYVEPLPPRPIPGTKQMSGEISKLTANWMNKYQ